jgi:hypothetical protein
MPRGFMPVPFGKETGIFLLPPTETLLRQDKAAHSISNKTVTVAGGSVAVGPKSTVVLYLGKITSRNASTGQ